MSRRIITPILIVGGVAAGGTLLVRRLGYKLGTACGYAADGTLLVRRLGYKLGTDVVVRCRQGHVYSTVWIPGVKLKAVDLAVARFQHCPVGKHWSLVVPVHDGDLADEELEFAQEHHDVPVS